MRSSGSGRPLAREGQALEEGQLVLALGQGLDALQGVEILDEPLAEEARDGDVDDALPPALDERAKTSTGEVGSRPVLGGVSRANVADGSVLGVERGADLFGFLFEEERRVG